MSHIFINENKGHTVLNKNIKSFDVSGNLVGNTAAGVYNGPYGPIPTESHCYFDNGNGQLSFKIDNVVCNTGYTLGSISCYSENSSSSFAVTQGSWTNYYVGHLIVSFETNPVEYIITLNKNTTDTSGRSGTTTLYTRYDKGIYLNSGRTQFMDAEHNPLTVPTRDGYTFTGYWSSSTGGTKYINAQGFLIPSNIPNEGLKYTSNQTWYAHWEKNLPDYSDEHLVTLDNRGANQAGTIMLFTKEGSSGGTFIDSDRTKRITAYPITLPSKTNYSFNGYYSATSGGTQYISSDGYGTSAGIQAGQNATDNITWYAQWTYNSSGEVTNSVLVFDKNGGTATNNAAYVVYYGEYPLDLTEDMIPTKDGYVFLGYRDENYNYYYNALGEATRVWDKPNGGWYTLYAEWDETYYNVRFYYGLRTDSSRLYDEREPTSDGYVNVPQADYPDDTLLDLNTGWQFFAYRVDGDDSPEFDSNTDVKRETLEHINASSSKILKLYSIYTRDILIKYSLDHGKSISNTQVVTDGYSSQFTDDSFTFYGNSSNSFSLFNPNTILGWSLTPYGDIDFYPEEKVTFEKLGIDRKASTANKLEVTLYAVLEEYYINYDLGENGYFPETEDFVTTMSLNTLTAAGNHIGIPERPNYKFKGWTITGMTSGLDHHASNNFYDIQTSNSIFGNESMATNIVGLYFYQLSNEEGATVTFIAIWEPLQRPGIHLNIGSLFQLAAPYIFCKKDSKTVASWHQMEPYIFDGSSWHLCGESGAAAQIIKFTSISIDGSPTVATDDGTVYTITASPSDATNQQVTVTVDGDGYFGTNTSTQEQIVVLSGGSGTVTIKSNAQGTTSTGTITVRPVVTDSDNVSASKSVTYAANVVKFNAITIEGDEPASASGTTYTVRATPINATNQKVKIEITGPGYLGDITGTTSQTITLNNGVGTFKITSTAQNTNGTGTITVTPEAATSSDVKATKQINYSAIIIQFTSITINGSDTVPYDGTEYNIVATPSEAANQKVIITVSGDGYLESDNASTTSKTITLSGGQGSFTVYSNSYSLASNQTITVTSDATSAVSTTKTVSYYPVICFIFYKTGGNDVTFSNSSYSKDGDGNIYYNNNSVWDALTYNNSYNAKAVSTFSASKSGYVLSGTYHAEQNTSLIVTPGTPISYANLISGMVNNINSSTGIRQQRLYLVLDWVENTQTLQETTETFRGFTLTEVTNVSSSKTWKASNGSSTTNLTVGAGYDNYISDQSDNTYYQAAHTGLGSDTFSLTFAFNDTFQHTPVAISSLKLRCRMTRSTSTDATKVTVNHYFYNSDLDLSNLIMHFTTTNVTSTLQNVTWTRTIEDHETLITAFLGSLNGGKNINLKDVISVEIPSALITTNTFKFYEMSLEVTYQYYA